MPFDRPLLRIANALNLPTTKDGAKSNSIRKGKYSAYFGQIILKSVDGILIDVSLFLLLDANSIDTLILLISASPLLRDVHVGIPSSGG